MIDEGIPAAKAAKPVKRPAWVHAYYVKAQLLLSSDGKEANRQLEEAWRAATSDPPDPTIPAGYIAQLLASNYSTLDQTDLAQCSPPESSDRDRKSTPLNSSHQITSYSLFCLTKKIPNALPLRFI